MDETIREIEKTEENFVILKAEISEYADSLDDIDESMSIKQELQYIKTWEQLTEYDMFIDVIGYIIEENEESLLIEA